MDSDFAHEPVMVEEVLEIFEAVPDGLIIDATVGGGGHAAAILESLPRVRLLGLDRDPFAVRAAARRLAKFGERAEVKHARFDSLAVEVARSESSTRGPLVGVLLDLGVSSPQLDQAERGFSYRNGGPLDMRMDQSAGRTAGDVLNSSSEEELARMFAANGEQRFASRIARAVVAARPLSSTAELAEVVSNAIPARARPRKGHPARRVFQALRIAVNEELDLLSATLPEAIEQLVPGGRCVAIAYHSGEDRLVKSLFSQAVSGGCVCPADLPCVCGAIPTAKLVFRGARRPSPAEVSRNHRAESARMRCVERIASVKAR